MLVSEIQKASRLQKFITCLVPFRRKINYGIRECLHQSGFSDVNTAIQLIKNPRDVLSEQELVNLREDLNMEGQPATDESIETTLEELGCIQSEDAMEWNCSVKNTLLRNLVKDFKIGILGMNDLGYEKVRMEDEIQDMGMNPKPIKFWKVNIVDGELTDIPVLDELDRIWVRSNALFLEDTASTFAHRANIAQLLEQKVETVNQLQSNINATDKGASTILMKKKNIPHPSTFVSDNITNAVAWISKKFDEGKSVVIKPVGRSLGIGIRKLTPGMFPPETREDLYPWVEYWDKEYGNGVFYLQEFVPNDGFDVRAFVVGDRVFAAMKRDCKEQFLHNVAQGCKAVLTDIPKEDRKLAVDAVKAHGLEYGGVDIIYNNTQKKENCSFNSDSEFCNKPYILEVNSQAGFKGIESASMPESILNRYKGEQIPPKLVSKYSKNNIARAILYQMLFDIRMPKIFIPAVGDETSQ